MRLIMCNKIIVTCKQPSSIFTELGRISYSLPCIRGKFSEMRSQCTFSQSAGGPPASNCSRAGQGQDYAIGESIEASPSVSIDLAGSPCSTVSTQGYFVLIIVAFDV